MAKLWAKQITEGRKTLEDVPRMLKEQVKALLGA